MSQITFVWENVSLTAGDLSRVIYMQNPKLQITGYTDTHNATISVWVSHLPDSAYYDTGIDIDTGTDHYFFLSTTIFAPYVKLKADHNMTSVTATAYVGKE